MFQIVLFMPKITPNTVNIILLAANTGCSIHLIEPLGFALDDKRLRRAGLDYGEWRDMRRHVNWESFLAQCQPERLFALTTKGCLQPAQVQFREGDYLLFGPETRGLPEAIRRSLSPQQLLRIPMRSEAHTSELHSRGQLVCRL